MNFEPRSEICADCRRQYGLDKALTAVSVSAVTVLALLISLYLFVRSVS